MDAIQLVRLALNVVSERVITILGLSMSFALACWTMWGPEWDRVVTLGIFILFSYLVIISTKRGSSNGRETET